LLKKSIFVQFYPVTASLKMICSSSEPTSSSTNVKVI